MVAAVTDTLTDIDNTLLENHTGDSGSSWVKNASWNSSISIIGNQLIGAGTVGYNSTAEPVNDSYSVSVDLVIDSLVANKGGGIMIRFDGNALRNGYLIKYSADVGQVALFRYVNGALSILPAWTFAFSVGTFNMTVATAIDVNGDPTFELFIDSIKIGATYIDTNAAAITIPGKFGVWTQSNVNKIDNIILDEAPAIVLNDLLNHGTYQQKLGVANIFLSGQQVSATSVEARIMSGVTEIVAWTAIDIAPFDSKFSGILSVPFGIDYIVEIRIGNNTGVTVSGVSVWQVGNKVLIAGQSNGSLWFSDSGAVAPRNDVKVYSAGWRIPGPVDKGAIAFGNMYAEKTGMPCGVIDCTSPGAALRQEAADGNGFFLSTANARADRYITNITNVLAIIGTDIDSGAWIQGERDARSGVVTELEYQSSLGIILGFIRTDVNDPSLPICINYLGKGTDVTDVDADFQAIRNAQKTVISANSNNYPVQIIDVPMRDTIHDFDHTVRAERTAQALLFAAGFESYGSGPSISIIAQVSSTVFDVFITHAGGSDFIPLVAISGFQFFDDLVPVGILSAVRQSPNSIRFTLSSAITGAVTMNYLHGANPDISVDVFDNSPLVLPLEWIENLGIVKSDSGLYVQISPGIYIPI